MKRVLAFLLCLCMVLALVPNNLAFMAKAATTGELVLDSNNQALCPVCNETVTWTAKSGTSRFGSLSDGTHKHYYLSGDLSVVSNSYLLKLTSSTNMCLHLNGYNITYDGYVQVSASTLNIMGTGNVKFTGTAPTTGGYWKFGFYLTSSGVLNLLGGNYATVETALENGVPMIQENSGKVTVKDATVNGPVVIGGTSLTLDNAAKLPSVQIGANSKLIVEETWTGSAKVNFTAGMVDNLIPEKNGVATGAFTGSLTMPGAVTLNATAEGRLQASGFNSGLVLDENSQALCPVCNEIVTWTAKSGTSRFGSFADGTHKHYYLSGDLNVTADSYLLKLTSGTNMCLHLNGHSITYDGYAQVTGSTLNIMGVGNVNFNGNAEQDDGWWKFGFYITGSGKLNLLGGVYNVTETALESGCPMVHQTVGTITVKDAEVNGTVSMDKGELIIDQTAALQKIQVASGAKLTVKSTWTGKAAVNFAAGLVDGVVPSANGVAEGVFTGRLSLTTGRALNGTAEGTLVQDDPNKNLVFNEDNQAYCPQCEAYVTWTALTGNKTFNGGGHHHYYLTKSIEYTAGATNFIRTYNGAILCLHLNGFDITHGSRMFIQTGSSLYIMGNGNVTFNATGGNDDSKLGGIRATGDVNLLGGSYHLAGNAVTEGRAYVSQTSGTLKLGEATLNDKNEFSGETVTVGDATVNGTFLLSGGTMTIDGATSFQDLQVGTGAKLVVNESWTGAATVNFVAGLEDNKVPTANGEAAGSFTGKLTTSDGSVLEGFADGTLRKVIKLELDENNQAYCPACDATVTWQAYSGTGRLGSFTTGEHRHYYLSDDVTYENANNSLFRTANGINLCLHLNDHNITTGSYFQVSSVVSIMGTGNVTFTGTALTTTGYWKYAAYVTGGTLNLMGGNYSVTGTAVENNLSTVYVSTSATAILGDVSVSGVTTCLGKLTLSKASNVEDIQMTGGKLTVNEGWAGMATVNLPVALVNGVVPAANGASTGTFAGGLVLDDGTLLKAEDGKLVANDYKALIVTADNRGYCKVCDKMVVWNPLGEGDSVGTHNVDSGSHTHYYFAEDNITAKNAEFMNLQDYNTVCLHLNNKTVKIPGRMRIHKTVLNIMGDGNVDFTATTDNDSYNDMLLYCWGSPYTPAAALNIYGGTFTSSAGKPVAVGYGTYSSVMAKISLYGNTHIDGILTLDQAHVYLYDGATIENIEASNTGSVRVDGNWYGTAEVSYLADMYEEYVNIFNGRSTGDFVGGLMMDGSRLIGESGRLRIVDAMDLRLNDKSQGYCPVCNAVVTWTGIEGAQTLGSYADGSHKHIYLTNDLDEQAAAEFLHLSEGSDLCLHLNGHTIIHGSAMIVESGSSLSVLGKGKVTYTGTVGQSGILSAGTVNLLSGTYNVEGTAALNNLPNIYATDGKVTVKDAAVDSSYLEKGTMTLDGAAAVEAIHIESAGYLSVADTWTGTAAVDFATGLTGKLAPAANVSVGKAAGKLTLLDGRELKVGEDGISVSDLKVSANVTYKLFDTYAEVLKISGSETILLPTHIGGKPVTKIAEGAFADFSGTLYIGKGDALGLAYAAEAGITYTEIAAINGTAGYATVEEALSAYTGGVVQLLTDAGNITVSKDLYLDLNGFDVANATVTSGTLYVMDTQTDDFTVADGNYGKITGKITGSVKAVPAETEYAEYGYLQVTKAEGVSFHCVAMDIYAMTLRADVAGVYYDCSFAADEVVAALVKSYGVALSAYGAPDETRKDWCYSEYTDFKAGINDNGTLLTNVMKEGLEDINNQARANMPMYGRAYIKTESGYVFGKTICRDLQEQVELTDRNWETYTKEQRKETRAMYETYQDIIDTWEISNVDKYLDRIWFTEPAPVTGAGWEQYSLPLGNGYLGTSVFGGTETETLTFSDKTMYNPTSSAEDGDDLDIPDDEDVMAGSSVGSNGFTNLCNLNIDFGHAFDQVTNYQRDLLLDTAEARVFYDYKGVTYNRTYFANYPDNVTVAKLEASQKGKVSFTLRPTPTYIRDHLWLEGDGLGKTGTVTASGDTAILSGTLAAYQINYEIQFKVIPTGGTMTANADGTITVENADSAVILITAGTNYEMKPETMTAAVKEKLDPNSFPHDKVTAVMEAASQKSYEELLETHLKDYQAIYGRVATDLSGEPSTSIPTNKQMQAYRAGDHSIYVEELLFKHGRYLLIASSREGTLPANLQGMWQYYASGAWRGGYVYNINLQMNYWSCYATNLLDMFKCNFEYFDAMWDTMETNADNYLTGVKSPYIAEKGTGANGIAIGASGTPYTSASVNASVSAHSGPATTAYTTSLLWEYYEFTGDKKVLEEQVWPYIEGCAIFLEKTLEEYDGKWLVSHSASPENNMWFGNGAPDGPDITVGCMFDQMFVYETFCQVKKAAEILGYTEEDAPILTKINEKIDKLDHVVVGKSGHIKEFREEEYYGEFGRYEHHGMAQLVGVYPATHVNSSTDAWQDAATVTATERGINYTGHQSSFKQLVWARLGNSDYAYLLAQDHITKYLRDNMWNTHTPFQIDGNFGYTAGVAEMLVQSHEGYISVLPALPEAWAANGSYAGLTARGGFEVGADWTDGSATQITITSKNGGNVSVKYFNLSTAKVTDSKGNVVTYTVDDRDIITFATVAGETYTMTELTEKVTVDAPSALTLTDGTKLTWKASPHAATYNVYRAVNSQPAYELVAEGITGTSYIYVPTDLKVGDQLILRVTAVNEDGVESTGVRVLTFDIAINEEDAKAMQAANDAYAAYTGETAKYMVYEYESRAVLVYNGVAMNVYDDAQTALKDIYDDPVTTANEADFVTLQQTTDGWYVVDEGYTQHTYVAFGDSITYGYDGNTYARMEKPYPTLVTETLGIGTVVNRAKNGATLTACEGRTNMTERVLTYEGEADIISVMLGVNDYAAKASLGDMSSNDNTTIYGSLHLIAQHVQEKYPDAFLFFMTPFKYRTENNGVYNLADVAQAVKDVAAAYNIPVLDMYTNGQFDPETSAADGIHPTQEHHIQYTAPMICEFIEANYDPKTKK